MRKKGLKMPRRVTCPYCGLAAVLREDSYVHGGNGMGKYLYVCKNYPDCNAYVGVHPGTKIPMGTLADSELRNKRIKAHKMLMAICENGLMTKKEAYRWIETMFGIDSSEAHIAKFSDYRCEELMKNCRNMLQSNNIPIPVKAG